MQKTSKRKKTVIVLAVVIIVAIIIVSVILAAISLVPQAQNTTVISVVPNSLKPNVGDTFTVNINISNATRLTGWQVALEYDVRVVNCTNAWVPDDNIFKNKDFFPLDYSYYDSNETGFGFIIIGATLLGENELNTPSPGTLCSLNFTYLSTGQTDLRIATKSTPAFQIAAFPIEYHTFIQNWRDTNDESPFVDQNGHVGQ